jgi:limonene-1,2-epoxide hydrolase
MLLVVVVVVAVFVVEADKIVAWRQSAVQTSRENKIDFSLTLV